MLPARDGQCAPVVVLCSSPDTQARAKSCVHRASEAVCTTFVTPAEATMQGVWTQKTDAFTPTSSFWTTTDSTVFASIAGLMSIGGGGCKPEVPVLEGQEELFNRWTQANLRRMDTRECKRSPVNKLVKAGAASGAGDVKYSSMKQTCVANGAEINEPDPHTELAPVVAAVEGSGRSGGGSGDGHLNLPLLKACLEADCDLTADLIPKKVTEGIKTTDAGLASKLCHQVQKVQDAAAVIQDIGSAGPNKATVVGPEHARILERQEDKVTELEKGGAASVTGPGLAVLTKKSGIDPALAKALERRRGKPEMEEGKTADDTGPGAAVWKSEAEKQNDIEKPSADAVKATNEAKGAPALEMTYPFEGRT